MDNQGATPKFRKTQTYLRSLMRGQQSPSRETASRKTIRIQNEHARQARLFWCYRRRKKKRYSFNVRYVTLLEHCIGTSLQPAVCRTNLIPSTDSDLQDFLCLKDTYSVACNHCEESHIVLAYFDKRNATESLNQAAHYSLHTKYINDPSKTDVLDCIQFAQLRSLMMANMPEDDTVYLPEYIIYDPKLYNDHIGIKYTEQLDDCLLPTIKLATVEKLLEKLIDLRYYSKEYTTIFTQTYKQFIDEYELLRFLKKIFIANFQCSAHHWYFEKYNLRDREYEPEEIMRGNIDVEVGGIKQRESSSNLTWNDWNKFPELQIDKTKPVPAISQIFTVQGPPKPEEATILTKLAKISHLPKSYGYYDLGQLPSDIEPLLNPLSENEISYEFEQQEVGDGKLQLMFERFIQSDTVSETRTMGRCQRVGINDPIENHRSRRHMPKDEKRLRTFLKQNNVELKKDQRNKHQTKKKAEKDQMVGDPKENDQSDKVKNEKTKDEDETETAFTINNVIMEHNVISIWMDLTKFTLEQQKADDIRKKKEKEKEMKNKYVPKYTVYKRGEETKYANMYAEDFEELEEETPSITDNAFAAWAETHADASRKLHLFARKLRDYKKLRKPFQCKNNLPVQRISDDYATLNPYLAVSHLPPDNQQVSNATGDNVKRNRTMKETKRQESIRNVTFPEAVEGPSDGNYVAVFKNNERSHKLLGRQFDSKGANQTSRAISDKESTCTIINKSQLKRQVYKKAGAETEKEKTRYANQRGKCSETDRKKVQPVEEGAYCLKLMRELLSSEEEGSDSEESAKKRSSKFEDEFKKLLLETNNKLIQEGKFTYKVLTVNLENPNEEEQMEIDKLDQKLPAAKKATLFLYLINTSHNTNKEYNMLDLDLLQTTVFGVAETHENRHITHGNETTQSRDININTDIDTIESQQLGEEAYANVRRNTRPNSLPEIITGKIIRVEREIKRTMSNENKTTHLDQEGSSSNMNEIRKECSGTVEADDKDLIKTENRPEEIRSSTPSSEEISYGTIIQMNETLITPETIIASIPEDNSCQHHSGNENDSNEQKALYSNDYMTPISDAPPHPQLSTDVKEYCPDVNERYRALIKDASINDFNDVYHAVAPGLMERTREHFSNCCRRIGRFLTCGACGQVEPGLVQGPCAMCSTCFGLCPTIRSRSNTISAYKAGANMPLSISSVWNIEKRYELPLDHDTNKFKRNAIRYFQTYYERSVELGQILLSQAECPEFIEHRNLNESNGKSQHLPSSSSTNYQRNTPSPIERHYIRTLTSDQIHELWFKDKWLMVEAMIPSVTVMRILQIIRMWITNNREDFQNNSDLKKDVLEFIHSMMAEVPSDSKEYNAATQVIEMLNECEPFLDLHAFLTPRTFSFSMNSNVQEIAEQLCVLDHQILLRLSPGELLNWPWSGGDMQNRTPHIALMLKRFNQFADLIVTTIQVREDANIRAKIITDWAELGKYLARMNHFYALMQVCYALRSKSIVRLKRTWALVSGETVALITRLKLIVSMEDDYKVLRQIQDNCSRPCIPYIGIYLNDLQRIEARYSGRRSNRLGVHLTVEFGKLEEVACILNKIRGFQQGYYDFTYREDSGVNYMDTFVILSPAAAYCYSLNNEPEEEIYETNIYEACGGNACRVGSVSYCKLVCNIGLANWILILQMLQYEYL